MAVRLLLVRMHGSIGLASAAEPGVTSPTASTIHPPRSKEEIVMTETVVNAMREEKIEGAAGKLLIRSLRPTGTTRGVVMIVPGFNAHSGYYGWAADQFVAIGLATYAVDLR